MCAPASGKIEAKRVESVSKTISHALVTAELADPKTGTVAETITGTPDHPVYMEGRGWVALGELGIGTSVVTRAGPKSGGAGKFGAAKSASASSSSGTLVVKSTHWKAHPEGVAVYNFIVEGFHTYFVGGKDGDKGSGGVWVHNGDPDDCVKILPQKGHGNNKPWRDAVAKVSQRRPRDFEAVDEKHARALAEDAGLVHDPNLYGSQQRGTYQIHPPEPDTEGRLEKYLDWPHLKYSVRKGVVGHIYYPPNK